MLLGRREHSIGFKSFLRTLLFLGGSYRADPVICCASHTGRKLSNRHDREDQTDCDAFNARLFQSKVCIQVSEEPNSDQAQSQV